MNRAQRRRTNHIPGEKTLVLKRILLTFEDGTTTFLDTSKVQIVDRATKKPLFDEVLDKVKE